MGKHINGPKILYDFGNFDGRHWPYECQKLENVLPAQELVDWDALANGEAEFWPAGDNRELTLVIGDDKPVGGEDLLALSALLEQLGGDSVENYLRIHQAMEETGFGLVHLTAPMVEACLVHVFVGEELDEVRRMAVEAVMKRYQPTAWIGDWKEDMPFGRVLLRFQESSAWTYREHVSRKSVAVLIAPKPKFWTALK